MTEIQSIPEASKEAIIKAKDAAEAIEISRTQQMQDMLDKSDARNVSTLSTVLKEVFGEFTDTGRFIDVKRIPLICSQIAQIHTDIGGIQDNIKWAVRIVVGGVLLALLKLIFIP